MSCTSSKCTASARTAANANNESFASLSARETQPAAASVQSVDIIIIVRVNFSQTRACTIAQQGDDGGGEEEAAAAATALTLAVNLN